MLHDLLEHIENGSGQSVGLHPLPLLAYVEVIEKTAVQFDIPVLNLYEKLGLDPTQADVREKYTIDGLHFNDAGHHIIAARLQEFLEAL